MTFLDHLNWQYKLPTSIQLIFAARASAFRKAKVLIELINAQKHLRANARPKILCEDYAEVRMRGWWIEPSELRAQVINLRKRMLTRPNSPNYNLCLRYAVRDWRWNDTKRHVPAHPAYVCLGVHSWAVSPLQDLNGAFLDMKKQQRQGKNWNLLKIVTGALIFYRNKENACCSIVLCLRVWVWQTVIRNRQTISLHASGYSNEILRWLISGIWRNDSSCFTASKIAVMIDAVL